MRLLYEMTSGMIILLAADFDDVKEILKNNFKRFLKNDGCFSFILFQTDSENILKVFDFSGESNEI